MSSPPTMRFDFTTPVPAAATWGRVHFIAIGGSGMSAVARNMLAHGIRVSGSDAADSHGLRQLHELGARVWVGHDPSHVDDADAVVISTAIREDNTELARARELGLPVWHRAQALAATMGEQTKIAIAGANGKTTTTSMITVALIEAGLDPSFASGGVLPSGTNAHLGSGPHYVVEADESDGSFLTYRPHVAVVTNVQADHLDFYGTFEHVVAAYRRFVDTIAAGGLLVACADDAGARELADYARSSGIRVLTYGQANDAQVRVDGVTSHELSTTATITRQARSVEMDVGSPGLHNVLNAVGAYTALVCGLGIDEAPVLAALAAFSGAKRRFDVIGTVNDITVVDDYAHNPAKVDAVVRTARQVAKHASLRVIFQPHLYSRTRDFAAEFAEALALADQVVLLDIYGAREQPMPGVSSALIGDILATKPGERQVHVGASNDEAIALVTAAAVPGDLVVTVGAGDVTTLAPLIVDELRGS